MTGTKLKITPPPKLESKNLTLDKLQTWYSGMKNCFKHDLDHKQFLKDGTYETWTALKTAPSPIISMYCNSEIVHITLDCGAEAPCILPEECKRLGLKINPPNQFANSIDKRKLDVIGEVRTVFERGPLKLTFEALVIPRYRISRSF